ncbi:MAG TPA: copper resistance protein NlpE N-terminal domain-containing protein [Chitinophagaceae bacterium]
MKSIFLSFFAVCSSLFLICCSSTQNTGDTSKTSLDWQGVYNGVVPCADCNGIATKITLRENNTYVLQTQYLGKSNEVFSSEGSFEWNKDGTQIVLKNIKDGVASAYYQVGENKLTQLDMNGKPVTGNLSSMYVLAKAGGSELNKYWKLIEVSGNAVTASASGKKEPHMILHTQDNRVNGSGGCNNFSGTFQLQANNRISFSPLAVTKMFCAGAQETEDLMLKAMQNTDSYYLKGDTLQLIRAKMAPLAKFVAVYLK